MTHEIISRITGNVGHITLNRPESLNALTYDMCAEITRLMTAWETDDNIGAVLIDGAGERAFCAGGDVILLHDSGKAGDHRAEDFWRIEYALNEYIHRYSKPYITLIDGFVMGGGVGLSVHGRHRVAGNGTMFAMPETGIGYFPDVGGTYFLPRLGMEIGQWLGLTGARLDAGQCCDIGVATAFIPTKEHATFTEALCATIIESDSDVLDIMERFIETPPQGASVPSTVKAFGAGSVPAILEALDTNGDEWAAKQASNIRRKSPLAMCVTHAALQKGAGLNFRKAMAAELDLSLNFLKTQDFYEGIRAQLIDKDRNPKWSHDNVSDVTDAQIARLFKRASPKAQEFLP